MANLTRYIFLLFPNCKIYLLTGLVVLLSAFQPLNESKMYVKTVVIDAGHGGTDPGCTYGGVYEKDINLKIALELGRMIQEKMKDVKVIYTRSTDVFVELHKRPEIAHRNNANVFISIHCNANENHAAKGTETYVMGVNKSAANLKVAMAENAVIKLEDNYLEKYDGFDPNSPEAYIIFSLYQDAFQDQSLLLASKIEEHFKKTASRLSKGVKQAGFLVLWKNSMPSVLIETGFLSNQEEREYLSSKEGQLQTATAIFKAFEEYRLEVEE
ncbi:MAG TPA: N-acetylmuramoyl-L-alanine amidase [Bacteroidia bacterium]|nr:N-acetylmuramoyl-L-alanine amidase [Bacteroidia bacterium]